MIFRRVPHCLNSLWGSVLMKVSFYSTKRIQIFESLTSFFKVIQVDSPLEVTFSPPQKGIPKGGLWTCFHCHSLQEIAKGGSKCQGEGRAKKGGDREDMETINFMLSLSNSKPVD